MVNLIDDWDAFEGYVGDKLGYYQLIDNGNGTFEIRVQSGKLGFKREYKKRDDAELKKIIDFCDLKHFLKISESVREDNFFK